jgi:hypothetical protein
MATETRKTGIDGVGTSGLGCALFSVLSRDGKRPDAYGKGSIGQLSPACGVRTSEVGPPQFRPCGDVLDQNRTLLLRIRIDTHLRDGEFNQDKTLGLFEAVGKIPKNKGLH